MSLTDKSSFDLDRPSFDSLQTAPWSREILTQEDSMDPELTRICLHAIHGVDIQPLSRVIMGCSSIDLRKIQWLGN